MKRTLIDDVVIVSDGRRVRGSVVVEGERIAEVLSEGEAPEAECDETISGQGCYLLPGVIDDHVHFRDPGLTHKADVESESRAAAAGGVTSVMDMPNTKPQTTTLEDWEAKMKMFAEKCRVNYSCYFGATNDNAALLSHLDPHRVCGVKLFMGSSTGNMLVDKEEALNRIFAESSLPVAVHCEDQTIIKRNTERALSEHGADGDVPVEMHPLIRSEEACYESSKLAVELARKHGARLHLLHVSTARELELLQAGSLTADKRITAEACVAHLKFADSDYARLGTRIKCNPAIKTAADRDALRRALTDGRIDVVATDHAPHLLSEKAGGAVKAVSGMPMLQFSLISMLGLADEGVLSIEQVVEKMCHAPALLFDISGRGFVRRGYKADLVMVARTAEPWTLTADDVRSKCGWSPLEGEKLGWQVVRTFVNGRQVYADGHVDDTVRGEELSFREAR
jgi:dihydroorotase